MLLRHQVPVADGGQEETENFEKKEFSSFIKKNEFKNDNKTYKLAFSWHDTRQKTLFSLSKVAVFGLEHKTKRKEKK